MDEIYIDLNFLTQSEKDILQDVLARDEEFRRKEKKRLSELKKELDVVKKSGARTDISNSNTKVCARCHNEFGLIFNTGAFCPKCKARVCKTCRIPLNESWLCTFCGKVRDVKAKSGAWFYEQAKTKGEPRTLMGTSLLRASLKRGISNKNLNDFDEPPAPPVIGLGLENHDKLHRPIPVHMSALRETEPNDSSYHTADSADDNHEVNKNYIKPFKKAVPVARGSHGDSNYSDKEDESPVNSSSECSTPTTVFEISKVSDTTQISYQENEQEKAKKDDEEDEEKLVFDYLNENQNPSSKDKDNDDYPTQEHDKDYEKNLEESDEFKSLTNRGSLGYYDTANLDHYPLPGMENEYSAANTNSLVDSQDTLDVQKDWRHSAGSGTESMESFKTADYLEPSDTPSISDFKTPTQSLHSDNESDFADARDSTPVPPENDEEFFSLEGGYTLEETYTDGGKVVPPEIITSAVEEDDIDRHENEDNEDTIEDIDQAFAEYGMDLKSRTLSDHFEMGSRESIVSYYSEAGEGHYGNIAVTGEVQFGLKYDFRMEKLEVQVHRARDIAAVDTKKKRSDPYVKVYLLPDKTKGGKRKTKTKKNTLNPEFDEILTFNISYDEMLTRSLWLCVWNHDRFGHNDFLGEVILPLNTYNQSGFSWEDPSSEWYPLRERRPEQSLMEYCGEIVIALKYVPAESIKAKKSKKKKEGGELHVQIKEAHNLKAKDSNGFSDPFCKAYLLPDKSRKTKRKTSTIRKNLNPKWNYAFVYERLALEELMDRALELTVWDWDRGASNDFLGGVRLGMGRKVEKWDDAEGKEIAAWQKMLDNHNEWNECTIKLSSLPRFHDKPPAGTDSELNSEEDKPKGKGQTEPSEEKTVVEKKENSKVSEKQNKEKEGFDNMAFTKTKGDEEEEKAMNSIFQTFNNFTSKFKTTPDKIENAQPEVKPRDVVDNSTEEVSNDDTNIKNSGLSTEDSGRQEDTNEQQKSDEHNGQVGGNSNYNKGKVDNSSNDSEQRISVPDITTIVTAPEPSEPEKTSEENSQKEADVKFSRHKTQSDNVLFFEGATLSSPDLELKRRHSTDFVSVPRPLNEELIQKDMEKRGTPFKRRSTKKIPAGTREQIRRESYSPRVERKSRSLQSSSPIEVRRKTLAELALESGYKAPPAPDSVDGSSNSLKFEESRDKVISAPPSDEKDQSEIKISGELYITLEYSQETRHFTVHIHTANNLAAVDQKRRTSDPYVKAYLLPDKRSKKKTKTVRDNLNPEFDEILKYQIGYDELLTRTLVLTVLNDDLFGRNDFLGEVVIPIGSFVEEGNTLVNSVAKWHKLCEKTEYEDKLTSPELIIALKYVTGDKVKKKGRKSLPLKGELMIQVLEAKNLPGKDADGMSDPFCKILLLPDKKGKTKQKTPVIKKSLNPSWNYKISYEDLTTQDLETRVLEISVWDYDLASRDEFLGGVRLGLGTTDNEWDDSTDDEAQIWHTMLNRSNVWIQVVVPLRPTMDSRKNK